MIAVRPGKRVSARTAPSGRPTTIAIATAARLIASDSSTIAKRVASPVAMSCHALTVSDIGYSPTPSTHFRQYFRESQIVEFAHKYAYKCRMDLLTTSEAADYLRLGERKLYE